MRGRWLAPSLVLAGLAVFPWLGLPVYFSSLLFNVFFFVALAQAWNIIGGLTGYLSFGHVAFVGLGAYTTAMLAKGFNLGPLVTFLSTLPAGLVASGVALLVGYPCLRLRGPYFAVITLCFAFVVEMAVKNVAWLGGADGLWLKGMKLEAAETRAVFYEVMLGLGLAATLTAAWIARGRFGAGLRAIKADEDVALAVGINAPALKIRAFVLSAFFPGVAGGVLAYYLNYIHPDIVFDINMSILMVLMALFGGGRHWLGPVLGAVILTLVNEALRMFLKGELARIIYGLLFIAVILYLPDGLTAWWQDRRQDQESE
ncbi:MAG: branched-chain amino acid ABC transporter permease [Thermodesulfobacteriota bacterium]